MKKEVKKDNNIIISPFILFFSALLALFPLVLRLPFTIFSYDDDFMLTVQVTLMVIGIPVVLCIIFMRLCKKLDEGGQKKAYKITICTLLILFVVGVLGGTITPSGGSGRTTGKCWVCGKSGSLQLDGSYYCFKHYNQRLLGYGDFD